MDNETCSIVYYSYACKHTVRVLFKGSRCPADFDVNILLAAAGAAAKAAVGGGGKCGDQCSCCRPKVRHTSLDDERCGECLDRSRVRSFNHWVRSLLDIFEQRHAELEELQSGTSLDEEWLGSPAGGEEEEEEAEQKEEGEEEEEGWGEEDVVGHDEVGVLEGEDQVVVVGGEGDKDEEGDESGDDGLGGEVDPEAEQEGEQEEEQERKNNREGEGEGAGRRAETAAAAALVEMAMMDAIHEVENPRDDVEVTPLEDNSDSVFDDSIFDDDVGVGAGAGGSGSDVDPVFVFRNGHVIEVVPLQTSRLANLPPPMLPPSPLGWAAESPTPSPPSLRAPVSNTLGVRGMRWDGGRGNRTLTALL